MIIDCHVCRAKVDAETLEFAQFEDQCTQRIYLLRCPSCHIPLVGRTLFCGSEDNDSWTDLVRVYPKPQKSSWLSAPSTVALSLDEAERCMGAGAYVAAAAMAGRALEAVCRHFGTKGTYLGAGIKELRDKGVIDARLLEWSEELRDIRNEAAHATDANFSAKDSEDILTFTHAIVDYVFRLTRKFTEFKKRKLEAEAKAKSS